MTIRPIEERELPVVTLTGHYGSPFAIIGTVRGAMMDAEWTPEEIKETTDDMMAGDYDHLLVTVMDLCEVN